MIFLDTSFLIAFEVDTDSNHEKASGLMDRIVQNEFGETLISDYIFDEALTAIINKTKDLEKAINAGVGMKSSFLLEKINDRDFDAAWDLFRNQKGTKFSFTDCTNLAVVRRMNIKNIATFDEDFKKIKEITVIDA